MNSSTHIFGPVPSRRLGLSLGIDLVPFKTCTLDCIYCELGKTATPVTERAEYVPYLELEKEIKTYFAAPDQSHQHLDYITLSGSGEPTLNKALPQVIKLLREVSKTPIALLTNGTLFNDSEVRREATLVDVILPSLDVISEDLFCKLNRPAPGLKVKEMVAGLIKLRQEFKGEIWLEILFCRGLNDTPQEIKRLIEAVAGIKPDKIQFNTVVRPGVLAEAVAVEQAFLQDILPQFGDQAEIIAPFARDSDYGSTIDKTEETILATLKRRPCTKSDLEQALGLKPVEVIKILDLMLEKGEIKILEHSGERYFQTTG
ncbi:MAG: radical SAM protein [Deltaproteobacteria bacterium]|nr:radical SAM protein [Candidatus Tharpella sp.]